MTREDMELYLNNEVHGRCDYDIYSTLIDFVQDDSLFFESRTCNNCKSKSCSVKRILLELDEINPDYFSCNDWEQK